MYLDVNSTKHEVGSIQKPAYRLLDIFGSLALTAWKLIVSCNAGPGLGLYISAKPTNRISHLKSMLYVSFTV